MSNSVWRCVQKRDRAVLPSRAMGLILPWCANSTCHCPLKQAIRQGRTVLVWLLCSAEQPTYFPMWCWGKRGVDHQRRKFSFSSCGYVRSCDTEGDVKRGKTAFSARCTHRDIIRPLILISLHKYSYVTRSKPLMLSLLLYPCYQVSQPFSAMEWVYHWLVFNWAKELFMFLKLTRCSLFVPGDVIVEPQNPAGNLHYLKTQR